MICPNCESSETKVTNVKKKTPDCFRRTRECLQCGYRWNTVELDEDMLNSLIGKKETENEQQGYKNS